MSIVRFYWFCSDGKNISLLSEIENAALTVGIEPQEVENALQNTKYQESLLRNMENGWTYGVNSVPTFIINDEYKLTGAQKPEVFQKVFEEIIAKRQSSSKSGIE